MTRSELLALADEIVAATLPLSGGLNNRAAVALGWTVEHNDLPGGLHTFAKKGERQFHVDLSDLSTIAREMPEGWRVWWIRQSPYPQFWVVELLAKEHSADCRAPTLEQSWLAAILQARATEARDV